MTDFELRMAMAEAHGWRHQPHEPCGNMDILEHWIDRQAKIHMELPPLEHWAWQCMVDLANDGWKLDYYYGYRVNDNWMPPRNQKQFESSANPARAVCEAWLMVCHKKEE